MNPLVLGSIESQMALNGDVGRVWCESYWVLPQDKGLLMVDLILTSDV